MKKLLISAGALAALALTTPAAAATPPNQASATATVNIVSPITLANNTPLNFGTVVGPFNGEVIHVDMAGTRTCPATVTCSAAAASAASFTITGSKGQTVVLTMPSSVTLNSGANSLSVDLSGDEPTTNPVLDATTGKATFAIGGKLTIPAGTVDGLYQNTFDVTANYQ